MGCIVKLKHNKPGFMLGKNTGNMCTDFTFFAYRRPHAYFFLAVPTLVKEVSWRSFGKLKILFT